MNKARDKYDHMNSSKNTAANVNEGLLEHPFDAQVSTLTIKAQLVSTGSALENIESTRCSVDPACTRPNAYANSLPIQHGSPLLVQLCPDNANFGCTKPSGNEKLLFTLEIKSLYFQHFS